MRISSKRSYRLHRQRPPLAPVIRSTRTRPLRSTRVRPLSLRLRVPSFLLPQVVKVLFQGLTKSFLPRQFVQVSITFIAAAPSVWFRLSLQVQPYVTLFIGSWIFSTFYFPLSSRIYSTLFLYSVFGSPPSPSINSSLYGPSVNNIHPISPSFGLLLHPATYSCTTLHHLRCIVIYAFLSLYLSFAENTQGIIVTPTPSSNSYNHMVVQPAFSSLSTKFSASAHRPNSTPLPRLRISLVIYSMAIIQCDRTPLSLRTPF